MIFAVNQFFTHGVPSVDVVPGKEPRRKEDMLLGHTVLKFSWVQLLDTEDDHTWWLSHRSRRSQNVYSACRLAAEDSGCLICCPTCAVRQFNT